MTDKPNVYTLGTTEFVPVVVSGSGTLLEFSVNPIGTRPSTYVPAVINGGRVGVNFHPTSWGQWRIFARWDAGPLIDCGIVLVA